MRFWRGVVRQAGTNSNPFTEPINLPSNIDGGLGVWTGFSPILLQSSNCSRHHNILPI